MTLGNRKNENIPPTVLDEKSLSMFANMAYYAAPLNPLSEKLVSVKK